LKRRQTKDIPEDIIAFSPSANNFFEPETIPLRWWKLDQSLRLPAKLGLFLKIKAAKTRLTSKVGFVVLHLELRQDDSHPGQQIK
jgi:hypothetical protein